jgi:hypothetical protein
MIALGLSGYVTQLAILGLILWVVFRVVRKAGYRRRQAWGLVSVSLLLAVVGKLVESYVVMSFDWVSRARDFTSVELATYTVVEFIFSPFVLAMVPLLFCSFRTWPVETQASNADVFG